MPIATWIEYPVPPAPPLPTSDRPDLNFPEKTRLKIYFSVVYPPFVCKPFPIFSYAKLLTLFNNHL